GKLKTEIRKNFNSSQMMTSNSLSMIKSLDAYLSSASKVKTRHLIESRTSWLSNKERRMLKAIDVKALKPNAIVAKDGSGNFTTINDALKAMPAKYKGRYILLTVSLHCFISLRDVKITYKKKNDQNSLFIFKI